MIETLPTVCLVGSPNVGKSTLFNAILGKRQAVTGPTPGTTRDRAYGIVTWNSRKILFIDTAGLVKNTNEPLEINIKKQSEIAMTEADLIIFVVDGKETESAALDAGKNLKESLRKNKLTNKVPVLFVVNKIDSAKKALEIVDKYKKTGFGEAQIISAITGMGIGDLLDNVLLKLPPAKVEKADNDIYATVSFVGRPNAGKSTLINAIAKEERVVVSDTAGTTRASVEIDINWEGKIIQFIDTAGMRRRSKIDIEVEEYALFQTYKSIEASDVVVLLLDASEDPARFDKTIAGRLKRNAKGVVIAINKIDLLKQEEIEEIVSSVPMLFPFLKFAKIVPISGAKKININGLLEAIFEAKKARDKIIPEESLTDAFKKWVSEYPPRWIRGKKKPIVYDIKQTRNNPPTFDMIVNEPMTIHFSYIRYIENQLRKRFGFSGTAIRIKTRKPNR